jgi:hypothetical protein
MEINLLDIPVFYINMKQDVEKNKYLSEKLSELGFKNVTRIEATIASPGIVGLSRSQHEALSKIPAPFIVMEDDCDPISFTPVIKVPEDADAVYLGNSPWARMNSHHGFFLQSTPVDGYKGTHRIYNMLSSHAILYLTDSYVDICKRTTYYCGYVSNTVPMDVPFADIQKWYNVYAFTKPHFGQKEYGSQMSNAPKWTRQRIGTYQTRECLTPSTKYFHPYKII